MGIQFVEESKVFHLYNEQISYIMTVLPNGHMGRLYYFFSLANTKQEYGVYGTTDFRQPAIEVLQENGSRLTDARFVSFHVIKGKPGLPGLPATYVEKDDEAETLEISLKDEASGILIVLNYTVFTDRACIARSAWIRNEGFQNLHLLSDMSMCMDLPDADYGMVQFSGSWGRERYVRTRKLEPGIYPDGFDWKLEPGEDFRTPEALALQFTARF